MKKCGLQSVEDCSQKKRFCWIKIDKKRFYEIGWMTIINPTQNVVRSHQVYIFSDIKKPRWFCFQDQRYEVNHNCNITFWSSINKFLIKLHPEITSTNLPITHEFLLISVQKHFINMFLVYLSRNFRTCPLLIYSLVLSKKLLIINFCLRRIFWISW